MIEQTFETIVSAAASLGRPLGYRKRGTRITRDTSEVRSAIQFQRSQSNTKDHIRFTINLLVTCKDLLDPEFDVIDKVHGTGGAHLFWRIGDFIDPIQDKWWAIVDGTDQEKILTEIVSILNARIFPTFEKYSSTKSIYEAWKSGDFPQTPEPLRRRYLQELEELLRTRGP